MFDALRSLFQSLRFQLILACSALLVVMLTVAVANNARLFDQTMTAHEDQHLAQLHLLFNNTLAGPLARRDLAALQLQLQELRQDGGIDYLVLQDQDDLILAAAGWDTAQPLPPHHASFAELPGSVSRFDGVVTLRAGDRMLGHVSYGISTDYMNEARRNLVFQSTLIGWLAFILGVILLAVIARWLTSGLRRLRHGVAALQRGESSVKLAVSGSGEIAQLTQAFNQMAQNLDERLEALQKSEARFHAIADYTFAAEAWFNPQGRLIWVNPSIERVTGYTPEECLQAKNLIALLIYERDRRFALDHALRAIEGSQGRNFETRLTRKDGQVIWVALNWQAIYDANGSYQGLRVSVDEIQARKEAELRLLDTVAELRRAQGLQESYLRRSNDERARLAALLNVMRIGVLFVDTDDRVIYCNSAFRRIFGFAEDENLTSMRAEVLIERSAGLRTDNPAFLEHLKEVEVELETSAPFEIELVDGRVITEISTLVQSAESGRYIGRLWTYEDVTEQKHNGEQLVQLATRDPLTDLYNRRRFHEELERMLADAARRKVEVGLLMVDLDGFKPINDEFGHQAGDLVLVTIAREVGAIIRRNEMIFRLGGDEFAVLASDTAEEDMIGLARRVGERIEAMRFEFEGRQAKLTASLGIALYPLHARNDQDLIACADHAMYEAKGGGRNRWRVAQPPK